MLDLKQELQEFAARVMKGEPELKQKAEKVSGLYTCLMRITVMAADTMWL
jgi:hypothetical protein